MKYLLPLLLLFCSCSTNIICFTSDKFTSRTNQNEQFSQISDWKESNNEIIIEESTSDSIKSTLKIKGQEKLKFKLFTNSIDTTKDENGNLVIRINAQDQCKNNCHIIFVRKEKDAYMAVYYTDSVLIYKVRGSWMMSERGKKVRYRIIWSLVTKRKKT